MSSWPGGIRPFTTRLCSLPYADGLIRTGEYQALVSIGHPAGNEFCELEIPGATLRLGIWDKTPYRGRRERALATGDQILDIIELARRLPSGCAVLCHCKKGRSRSAAASLILQAAIGFDEDAAVNYLLERHPRSTPNGWMLKLADAILDTTLFLAAKDRGCVKWT